MEKSQENFHDGVYFSKAASVQSKGCNSNLNKLDDKFFQEYTWNIQAVLKGNFEIKVYVVPVFL